eukprot:764624-Hanusia_phi.AAC.4
MPTRSSRAICCVGDGRRSSSSGMRLSSSATTFCSPARCSSWRSNCWKMESHRANLQVGASSVCVLRCTRL